MKKPARNIPDTNAIIRYLVRDNDALYAKSKEFFDRIKNGSDKAIILESVVAESIYVLTKVYKVPKNKAASSLTDILHYKGIVNEDRDELISALGLFSEHAIDIVDCILCAKTLEPEMVLFSFDDDLIKMAARNKH